MFVVVVALLAQDWSALEGRRELSPDETRAVRQRMIEWTAHVPAFAGLQGFHAVEIVRTEQVPHVRIEAVTVTEVRRVEETLRPHRDGRLLHRGVTEVDAWDVAVPAPSPEKRFASHERRVSVERSGEVRPCARCSGTGLGTCATCQGEKKSCTLCGGKGRAPCMLCNPPSARRGACSLCKGSREASCLACFGSGRQTCRTCMSHGLSKCVSCDGVGRVVLSLEVVVTATARREERSASDPRAWWPRLVPFGDAWSVEAEGAEIEASVVRVRDERLRRTIRETLAATRMTTAVEVARRVRVQNVPVTHVQYRWGGSDYELVVTARGIVATETPMTRWARARVQEGDALAQRKSWREAEVAYREALAVDPACMPARVGLDAVGRATAPSWQGTALWVLVPVAIAVALTMAGLKAYVRRRRVRPLTGDR